MRYRLHFTFFAALLLIVQFGFSQELEDPMYQLNENDLNMEMEDSKQEVVSASRSKKFAEELPVTVYVITREEILQNGYASLVDVLKSVPGIKVSQPGSAIDGETFTIRGLYGNYYAKIMIDNVPVQPTVTSGMPIGYQLPIRQAERIEIIMGPASAIYGADALAGTINIVTHESERPVYAQADIALGNDGAQGISVMISGKAGKGKNVLGYSLFGNMGQRSDLNVKYDIAGLYNPSLYDTSYSFLNAPYYQGDSTTPVMHRLPGRSSLIGFMLKWRGLKFSFHTMYRQTHSSIGQATNVYSYADPGSFWGEKIDRYTLSYEKSWKKLSTLTNASWLQYRLNNLSTFSLVFDGGVKGKPYKYAASDDIYLEEIITYNVLENLEFVGGVNFQYSGNLPKTNDLVNPFDPEEYKPFSTELPDPNPVWGYFGYNPVVFNNIGAFLQVYYSIWKFRIIAGYRYDHHSVYGSSSNPRLAVLFKASDKISVRASYGKGFRAPSTYYSYSSLAYEQDGGIYYQTIPNPGLKPEQVYALELGMRWKPVKKIDVDLIAYFHRLNQQITRTIIPVDRIKYPDAVNDFTWTYLNDGNSEAKLYGLQINVKVKDLVPAVKLKTDLFLSLSKGKEILPLDRGQLDDYRGMPRIMGQLNFSLRPWKPMYIFIRNVFSGEWPKKFFPLKVEEMERLGRQTTVDGFYTMDMTIRFTISRHFHGFFLFNNIFNAQYGGLDAYGGSNDLLYNPQYGRNFRIGLTFDLE